MIMSCPYCGKQLKVLDTLAGRQGRCPSCKQTFRIPTVPLGLEKHQTSPKTQPVTAKSASQAGRAHPLQIPSPTGSAGVRAGLPLQPTGTEVSPVTTAGVMVPRPGTVPPPLPKPVVPKTTAIGEPPPIPTARATTGRGVLDVVTNSLIQAFDIHKIGFFFLMAVGIGVCLLPAYIVMNFIYPRAGAVVTTVFTIGMSGVITGGVARLTHLQRQGHPAHLVIALSFCGRRFLSLFGAAILVNILVIVIMAIVNGLVATLNKNEAGSLLGAILFIPQTTLNLVLIVAAVVNALVCCSIAVEDFSALTAISRFISCLRRQTRELIVHLTFTFCFSVLVTSVLLTLVAIALILTNLTNGPDVQQEMLESLGYASGKSHHGDLLRWFSMAIMGFAVLAYPSVYWIVSFTNYYENALLRDRSSLTSQRSELK